MSRENYDDEWIRIEKVISKTHADRIKAALTRAMAGDPDWTESMSDGGEVISCVLANNDGEVIGLPFDFGEDEALGFFRFTNGEDLKVDITLDDPQSDEHAFGSWTQIASIAGQAVPMQIDGKMIAVIREDDVVRVEVASPESEFQIASRPSAN
jgi:hypothetical protein